MDDVVLNGDVVPLVYADAAVGTVVDVVVVDINVVSFNILFAKIRFRQLLLPDHATIPLPLNILFLINLFSMASS